MSLAALAPRCRARSRGVLGLRCSGVLRAARAAPGTTSRVCGVTFDAGTPAPEVVADDHALAAWLAEVAGRCLLEVRQEGLTGKELKDAGDRAAHELLMGLLAEHRPQDAVLSEEGKDDKARLGADKVWIVDPLDGTREFSEPPRDDWAVHVALWQGGDLIAGAVAQPALGETFSTGNPPVVPPRTSTRPRIAVSRSRPPAFVEALAAELDAELVPMGSAGVKMMSVVRDVADAYVHAGGQYEWDSAAPVAVARSAGLFTSRVDGSDLIYNQDDVYLPDVIVCRPELSDQILAFIDSHGTDG
ncbi:3'(2'),5'-bisphosphate nucleotidase CysQ [Nocardioides sp. BGMRC 2183]|nr:3'(2'),5'-bisphosphate nucleotidase CysQ [Nocardioides sp. BGMRC 2183]